jgi:predicted dehydrogenase
MNDESSLPLSRRRFLKTSLGLASAAAAASRSLDAAESISGARLKAAVIGHTGKGNYGHELDLVFNDRPNIEVVAVADPDAAGRAKAAARCKAAREYPDYRQMLEKEKPDLVCVAPRWTDQHHAMTLAALQIGAHAYLEKPFTQTLAEADDLLAVAEKAGLKIAVAHQMRLAPSIRFVKKALEDGAIGQLLEIRAHGKQDTRAGGEDMVVLGTHLFDLMRLFAGDASWCAARVLQEGREVTLKDARTPAENIGPVVGDEIQAQFAFANGVNGSFTSRGKNRQTAGHWGLELVGVKGVVKILADVYPNVFVLKSGEWSAGSKTDEWQRMREIRHRPFRRLSARLIRQTKEWWTIGWTAFATSESRPAAAARP